MAVRPAKIQLSRSRAVLIIHWDDGSCSEFSWQALRAACPCAECNREPGQEGGPSGVGQVLIPLAPAIPAELERAEAVGNYALQLYWKDGHSWGIYSWDYLRQLAAQAEDGSK